MVWEQDRLTMPNDTFKASPAGFDLVGKNQLGEEVLATPTICGGRIYMRVAVVNKGKREEMLYCLGVGELNGR